MRIVGDPTLTLTNSNPKHKKHLNKWEKGGLVWGFLGYFFIWTHWPELGPMLKFWIGLNERRGAMHKSRTGNKNAFGVSFTAGAAREATQGGKLSCHHQRRGDKASISRKDAKKLLIYMHVPVRSSVQSKARRSDTNLCIDELNEGRRNHIPILLQKLEFSQSQQENQLFLSTWRKELLHAATMASLGYCGAFFCSSKKNCIWIYTLPMYSKQTDSS